VKKDVGLLHTWQSGEKGKNQSLTTRPQEERTVEAQIIKGKTSAKKKRKIAGKKIKETSLGGFVWGVCGGGGGGGGCGWGGWLCGRVGKQRG